MTRKFKDPNGPEFTPVEALILLMGLAAIALLVMEVIG